MAEKIVVTEEMHPEKEWFAEARKQTVETLPAFIKQSLSLFLNSIPIIFIHGFLKPILVLRVQEQVVVNQSQTAFVVGLRPLTDEIPHDEASLKTGDATIRSVIGSPSSRNSARGNGMNDRAIVMVIVAHEMVDEASEGYPDKHPVHPDVIAHWKSIVDGHVPFGYSVLDD